MFLPVFTFFFLSVYRCDAAVGRPALTVLTKEERANRQYSLGCFFTLGQL